jgi:hypothetical protein
MESTDETCAGFATRDEVVAWAEEVLELTHTRIVPEGEGGPSAADNWLAEVCAAVERHG